MIRSFSSSLRPLLDFVVQVIVGAIGFAVILCVAVALGWLMNWVESLGYHPAWFIKTAQLFKIALFGLDLLLFSLFVLAKAAKLVRSLFEELGQS